MAELTSYKKTKTTQQQSPQHDSHRSPDSWPCRRTLAQRSVPIAAAASSGQKATIPNKVRGELELLMALGGRRFHPGRWLSASDRLRLTLSCRSSVVSFRREEAAPPSCSSSSSRRLLLLLLLLLLWSQLRGPTGLLLHRGERPTAAAQPANRAQSRRTDTELSRIPAGLVDPSSEQLSRTARPANLISAHTSAV